MKLLDILGTTSETFSLGSGEKKIELRSIDGALYFRNFGTGWQRASSESLREALKLRTWFSGILLGENELFLYNNSIWYSSLTFTSTSFSDDANNFVKLNDTLNFFKIDVSTITSINLNPEVSNSIFIEGENTSIAYSSVTLPDATSLHLGRQILFINDSNIPVRIYKKNSTEFFIVKNKSSLSLVLTINSSVQGEWSELSFSGGSSGGSGNIIDVTLTLTDYNPVTPTNPFSEGDVVWYNPVDKFWQKAYTTNETFDLIGIVTFSESNQIKVAVGGQVDFTNITLRTENNVQISEGNYYYLTNTEANAGKFTNLPGAVNKKLFIALSDASIYILSGDYERFNEKKIYSLDNEFSVNLNEGFSYRFDGFIQDDPNLTIFNGYIYNSTPVDALIESSSDIIFDSDSTGGLCFFMDGNNLKMKNNLGSAKKIVIYRKKIK